MTEALSEYPDSILLNGGDNFQGTLWYNIFKWNVTQYFLNKLPFDAIVSIFRNHWQTWQRWFKVLGNHEFDDGIHGVVPFIKNLKAPVIVSNIDDSLEPDIQNIYKKSVVVERQGKKIGIIGVIIKTADVRNMMSIATSMYVIKDFRKFRTPKNWNFTTNPNLLMQKLRD